AAAHAMRMSRKNGTEKAAYLTLPHRHRRGRLPRAAQIGDGSAPSQVRTLALSDPHETWMPFRPAGASACAKTWMGRISRRRRRREVTARAILQIVPRLDAGGAERTTIDISRALTASGYRA